jgi:hypothetical protein
VCEAAGGNRSCLIGLAICGWRTGVDEPNKGASGQDLIEYALVAASTILVAIPGIFKVVDAIKV